MKQFRALLIEWDPRTSYRAGGIPIPGKGLLSHGWQDMTAKPALELRLVYDDRDLTVPPYADTPGVTVIIGEDAINTVIGEYFPMSRERCV